MIRNESFIRMPLCPLSMQDSALENSARQSAEALLDTIIGEATSAADVPRVLKQIMTFMLEEWSQIDWNEDADRFGVRPFTIDFEMGAALTDKNQLERIREFLDSGLRSDNEDD